MSSACTFVLRTNVPLIVTPLYGIDYEVVVLNVRLGVVNAFWGAWTLH